MRSKTMLLQHDPGLVREKLYTINWGVIFQIYVKIKTTLEWGIYHYQKGHFLAFQMLTLETTNNSFTKTLYQGNLSQSSKDEHPNYHFHKEENLPNEYTGIVSIATAQYRTTKGNAKFVYCIFQSWPKYVCSFSLFVCSSIALS